MPEISSGTNKNDLTKYVKRKLDDKVKVYFLNLTDYREFNSQIF